MVDPAALPWLPRSPQDFRAHCAEVDKQPGRGDLLRRLAGHALGANELQRLARSVTQALADNAAAPLQEFTLGVVSNTTTDFILPALIGSAARHGIALRVATAPFGMTMQAALDPASEPLASRPHAILLALDYRAYFGDYALEDDPTARVTAALAQLQSLVTAFSDATRAVLLVQTIVAPPERLFGSFDRGQPGTGTWHRRLAGRRVQSRTGQSDPASWCEHTGCGGAGKSDRAGSMVGPWPIHDGKVALREPLRAHLR